MTPSSESSAAFLIEGGRSYLDAILAVREFERRVMETVREVVEKRWEALAQITGPGQNRNDLIFFKQPEAWFRGDATYLGIKQWLSGINCDFYFSVQWERKAGGLVWLGAACDLEFPRRTELSFVTEKWTTARNAGELSQVGLEWKTFPKGIRFKLAFSSSEMVDLEAKLNTTLDLWIQAWNMVGGMAACMEQIKSATTTSEA